MHDHRSTPPRVRFGAFELDVRSGELRKGPSRLKVPDKSIEILKALLEQPGELDGTDVVFASTRNKRMQIFRKPSDLSRAEALLLDSTPPRNVIAPTDWSSDGKYIAYTESGGNEPTQIWMLPLSGSRTPSRFRQANAHQGNAHFSPDGNWVVFTSEELGSRGEGTVSGREVWVAPFSGADPMVRISDNGGLHPSWSRDGNEIFFLSPDGMLMSARVTQGRRFSAEPARRLFPVAVNTSRGWGNQYAASRDGRRFLINALDEPRSITYVLDWLAMIKPPRALTSPAFSPQSPR